MKEFEEWHQKATDDGWPTCFEVLEETDSVLEIAFRAGFKAGEKSTKDHYTKFMEENGLDYHAFED